jgi:hypothetical protein
VFTARYELNLLIRVVLVYLKWDGVVGIGWSWLRIGTGGGYL